MLYFDLKASCIFVSTELLQHLLASSEEIEPANIRNLVYFSDICTLKF
jgi:hypothetical protein